jgi:hypothetical protein
LQLASPSFQERLVEALHADEEFVLETRWFDGSILLESGDQRCWLKVYRGQVIETFDHVPAFGYTFKVAGPDAAWDLLVRGERTFTDLRTPGSRHVQSLDEIEPGGSGFRPAEILVEGNQFEAGRMHIALQRVAHTLAVVAGQPVPAAA